MTTSPTAWPSISERWTSWEPYLRSLLRIMASFLFIQFGTAKLYGLPAPIMPGGGTAPFGSLAWFAGVLETYGGLLLFIGFYTRPVAFILSGEMAIAYFKGHAPQVSGPYSIRVIPRSCSVSSSCTWPRGAQATGVWTRSSDARGRVLRARDGW